MMTVLRILCVLMVLAVTARASSSVLIEAADHRSLRELGMEVVMSDLEDVGRMQAVLIEGLAKLGVDYEIEGAILLWCARTHRVFFSHPSGKAEERTRLLLRTALEMSTLV